MKPDQLNFVQSTETTRADHPQKSDEVRTDRAAAQKKPTGTRRADEWVAEMTSHAESTV